MIQITLPKNIMFQQRDPNKIGNGRFDFDVIYEGNTLGLLNTGNRNPMVPFAPNFMLTIGDRVWSLPITLEAVSHLKTNEEIFDVLREPLAGVYNYAAKQDNN